MSLVIQPSIYVIRVSTVLPAGGADTAVTLTPIKSVQAVAVVSGPVDAQLKFGGTGASAVPIAVADPVRNALDLPELYASSSAGGTLVLELHGR